MTKTNKSYTKRIKQTRSGKLVTRPKGQNHFNAKQTGESRQAKRGTTTIRITNKSRAQFLPR